MDRPFDVVTANLPFQVLRDLAALRDAARHGAWIVSGINEKQAGVLQELFLEQGYEIAASHPDLPWVTFVAMKGSLLQLIAPGNRIPGRLDEIEEVGAVIDDHDT